MSIVSRLTSLVREHGCKGLALKSVGWMCDTLYEWRMGIDTLAIQKLDTLTVPQGSKELGNYYEGSRLMPLRKLIPTMQSMVATNAAMVDCGCGKGKVLLVAAECGVQEIRGVEFASELCEIARNNIARVQRSKQFTSRCEVICSDILQYDIAENDSMFFLFNPFAPPILEQLLRNIVASVEQHPREIVIAVAFMNESYGQVFEKFPSLTRRADPIHWACKFTLFVGRGSANSEQLSSKDSLGSK